MTMKPTPAQFSAYQAAFDHFNARLFGGTLSPCVLNFSRKAKSAGFFAPERWTDKAATHHEISLNPTCLALVPLIETMAVLVHEMAHQWQREHGAAYPKRPYHNREWAAKMDEVGLTPSSTGQPGGKRTGQRMSHVVVEGGPFWHAFNALPESARLPLVCQDLEPAKRKARNKRKYTCQGCGTNVWGKPGLVIRCEGCGDDGQFVDEEGDDGDESGED